MARCKSHDGHYSQSALCSTYLPDPLRVSRTHDYFDSRPIPSSAEAKKRKKKCSTKAVLLYPDTIWTTTYLRVWLFVSGSKVKYKAFLRTLTMPCHSITPVLVGDYQSGLLHFSETSNAYSYGQFFQLAPINAPLIPIVPSKSSSWLLSLVLVERSNKLVDKSWHD